LLVALVTPDVYEARRFTPPISFLVRRLPWTAPRPCHKLHHLLCCRDEARWYFRTFRLLRGDWLDPASGPPLSQSQNARDRANLSRLS